MKTKINKTKNIFEDTIENCIWINPYNYYSKLYKHTFTRIFKKFLKINKPCSSIKSGCKNESPDCDKKDDKDIIPAGGHDICNHLTRYDVTNTCDYNSNNWQRKQI